MQKSKTTKLENCLTVLFFASLASVALCLLIDAEGTKDFVNFVMKAYAYLFFGSLTLAIIIAAVLFLLDAVWNIWEEESNKFIAAITIVFFLMLFAASFIFDGGSDIPFARFYAR